MMIMASNSETNDSNHEVYMVSSCTSSDDEIDCVASVKATAPSAVIKRRKAKQDPNKQPSQSWVKTPQHNRRNGNRPLPQHHVSQTASRSASDPTPSTLQVNNEHKDHQRPAVQRAPNTQKGTNKTKVVPKRPVRKRVQIHHSEQNLAAWCDPTAICTAARCQRPMPHSTPQDANVCEVSLFLDANLLTNIDASMFSTACRFHRLTELYVGGNALTNMDFVCEIPTLKEFWANDNQIDTVPAGIKELKYLRDLNLKSNKIVQLPGGICECKRLRCLDVSNNLLTALPVRVGQLWQLHDLRLENNRLLSLPNSFGALSNLNYISITKNPDLKLNVGTNTKLTCLSGPSLVHHLFESLYWSLGYQHAFLSRSTMLQVVLAAEAKSKTLPKLAIELWLIVFQQLTGADFINAHTRYTLCGG
eukprot:m.188716 g.188716  ORF g.188716 m.188716 type:complete len:418 (-) comp32356_c1_seq1:169-1422(-)